MGKKFRQLTGQGQTVKGALAFYLAPKMAEDQRLKAGELDNVLKSITPGRYEKQINGIVGTVKEKFEARLAMDESLDDLSDLLATLIPAEGEYAMDAKGCVKGKDEAEDEDDDSDEDAADMKIPPNFLNNTTMVKPKKKGAKDSAAKLTEEQGSGQSSKNLADSKEEEDDIDDEEEDKDDESDESDDEEGEEEDDAEEKPKGKDKKMNKDKKGSAKDSKPSMDAAFRSLRTLATQDSMHELQARYEAQEAVRPYVGKIDVLACDSVFGIYKLALTANKIDTRGVPETAFPAMVKMLPGKLAMDQKIELAQDGTGDDSFRKQFPNAPTLA
jgi:hypothetical protein